MSKVLDKILYAISDMFVPLIWGLSIGALVGTMVSTMSDQRAIRQDCQVMNAFRLGDQAFDCIPRRK
jgi:hypothetical protein